MRVIRSGMVLVTKTIDQIGVELANDQITSEMAARNLTALEEMPLHHIAHIFSPGD